MSDYATLMNERTMAQERLKLARARIAELEAMNERCMSAITTAEALCINHEGRIETLMARLSLAEKVVEAVVHYQTYHDNGPELRDALAAWRKAK